MRQVLFVDDEPRVLDGLKRMLHPFRQEWDMTFVSSGGEALERLSEKEYDAIVTDIHMPDMGGVTLLRTVVERYPATVRIVLSGTADHDATLPAIGLAHQYLVKPCDANVLRDTLRRVLALRFLPGEAGLQRLVNSVQSLPSLPSAYLELARALENPETSCREVGAIIARDLGMSAKVLQVVNSAYFGLRRQIRNPADAVVYMGIEMVKTIALAVSVFSQFDRRCNNFIPIAEIQDHSLRVAALAQRIARSMKLPAAQVDEVFTSAFLHDIGKLVLAGHFREKYRAVTESSHGNPDAAPNAEVQAFGASHAQVGAYLLWLWGLPELTTQIVAEHHGPTMAGRDTAEGPVVAVRAADAIVHGQTGENLPDWLCHTGYADLLPLWVDFHAEDAYLNH